MWGRIKTLKETLQGVANIYDLANSEGGVINHFLK